MKKLFLIFLILVSFFSFSQEKKIDSLKSALTNEKSTKKKIEILENLSQLLINSSTPDESIVYFEQMANLSNNFHNKRIETKAYKYLSESYFRKENYNKAIEYSKKILSINDSIKNIDNYLVGINQLGRSFDYLHQYDKAIITYKRVYNIDKNLSHYMTGIVLFNLGTAYHRIRQDEKAIQEFINVRLIAKKLNNKELMGGVYNSLAWIYISLEQYNKSVKNFNNVLIDSINYQKEDIITAHHGLGLAYSRWGKYNQAVKHNLIALKYLRNIGNLRYEFDVLNNLLVVFIKKNELTKANEYADSALYIAPSIGNKAINTVNINKTSILIKLKKYNQAKELLNKIVKDTLDPLLNDRDFRESLFENLYVVNKEYKNYSIALKFHEKYKNVSDSIIKEQRDSKITEIETKYNNEKIEKELIQKEKDFNIERNKNQQYIIYILLLVLISLLSIIAYAYYHKKFVKNKKELSNIINKITKIEKELFTIKDINTKVKSATDFNKKEYYQFLMKKYDIEKFEIIETWESIANGISRKQFAKQNKISENTIKTWRNELYSKLKSYTNTEGRYSDYKAVIEYYNSLRWYESQLSND